jgi:membrane-bound ClpP family serine protease
MSQFLSDNWAWILVVVVGVAALWLGLAGPKRGRVLVWGPLASLIDGYLARRRGFTSREKIGWAALGVLMLIVLVVALRS